MSELLEKLEQEFWEKVNQVTKDDVITIVTDLKSKKATASQAADRIAKRCSITREITVTDQQALIEDLVKQFAYWGGGGHITGGLSVLESAFAHLGWDEPHIDKSAQCQIEGCNERATCGTPTKNGYKHFCGKHYHENAAAERNDRG